MQATNLLLCVLWRFKHVAAVTITLYKIYSGLMVPVERLLHYNFKHLQVDFQYSQKDSLTCWGAFTRFDNWTDRRPDGRSYVYTGWLCVRQSDVQLDRLFMTCRPVSRANCRRTIMMSLRHSTAFGAVSGQWFAFAYSRMNDSRSYVCTVWPSVWPLDRRSHRPSGWQSNCVNAVLNITKKEANVHFMLDNKYSYEHCSPSVLWHCWLGHVTCKNCYGRRYSKPKKLRGSQRETTSASPSGCCHDMTCTVKLQLSSLFCEQYYQVGQNVVSQTCWKQQTTKEEWALWYNPA